MRDDLRIFVAVAILNLSNAAVPASLCLTYTLIHGPGVFFDIHTPSVTRSFQNYYHPLLTNTIKMDTRTENPLNATPETTRVIVANYVSMSIAIIVLVTRFGIARIKWKRAVGLDEIFLSLALLCAMIESALTEHAVRRGLGTYIRPGQSARLKWLSQVCCYSVLHGR